MCCFDRLSPLYMPYTIRHIPWSQRTRRQKVIIVTFLVLIFVLMVNVVGWVAYVCVYLNDEKYSGSSTADINASLT